MGRSQDQSGRVRPFAPRVSVYLPPGYDASTERYPVIYAQDGQNLFDPARAFGGTAWDLARTCDRLIAAGEMAPVIIVAVDNSPARMDEYTPVPDAEHGGGRADDYGRYLAEELKPLVDARLRTKAGPEDTALLGSSLGGLVSLHLALTRPDVFSRAAALSPSLWWAEGELMRRPLGRARPRLWLDMGTREGSSPLAWRQNVDDLRTMARRLEASGWKPGEDLTALVFDGAAHHEAAWRDRAAEVLKFLFPPL